MFVKLTLPTKMISFLEDEGYILSFCSSPSGMHRRLLCETLNKYGWLNWTCWTYIVVWSVNSGEVFEDWLFIFIVGNLSNEKNSEMQLPVKLIFGWRERIKLMKEIWECPAQDSLAQFVLWKREKDSNYRGIKRQKSTKTFRARGCGLRKRMNEGKLFEK